MKRLLDIIVSATALVFMFPIILFAAAMIWLEDRGSPFYVANRIGRGGKPFKMVKLRSMILNADKLGIDSTSSSDPRITRVGKYIRKSKLDEICQILNILIGNMSLVGPRPNVLAGTQVYTLEEQKLLTVRPGLTDIASIVFSDEGDILSNHEDPDFAYDQIIRPWKSRLGLLYIENQSLKLDLELLIITMITLIHRPTALKAVSSILSTLGADVSVIRVATREFPLTPALPPGADG